MKSDLILYRNDKKIPLGHVAGFFHQGIRHEHDRDSFEKISEYYGYTVNYSDNVSDCDMIVFNLHRNHIYSNLNPVLFVEENVWEIAKAKQIPIVFWHTGECHDVVTESWFTFAEMYVQQKIWYVDSNARLASDYHLFFDSSNLLNKDVYFEPTDMSRDIQTKYKFFCCTRRTDYHKHIIMKHLKTNHANTSWTKYTDADVTCISPMQEYQKCFPDFSIEYITPDSENLSDIDLLNKQLESSVIITLNTYFVKSLNYNDCYDPLYITEKFSQELSTNKPMIPVGHHGTLGYLRDLGFNFPSWIDYSYDNEKNENKRMKMILNEIDRLSKLSNLQQLSEQFQEISNNHKVFCSMNFKSEFTNCVNSVLGINRVS